MLDAKWILATLVLFAALGGCGAPSLLITPVSGSTDLEEEAVASARYWFAPKIAMIEVEGLLLNMKTGGFLQAGENDVSLFTQQLDRAEADSSVKAVLLRINSPGGTVSATDVMYESIMRFKQRSGKKVVAMTQDVAASGGYYVACAADRIIVQPTSVVGSIGVIFNTFDVSGTLGYIGVKSEAIKSGPMKDMGSPFRPIRPEERAVMQEMVDEFYGRFKGIVKQARKLDDSRTAAVSDGRVFTGAKAVELGLADSTGMLPDAITLTREVAGLSDAEVVMYRRPYGYGGSIYARQQSGAPQANLINVQLPPTRALLPTGFYYLWEP